MLSQSKGRDLRLLAGVAAHLQGGGGALELQPNNVVSQGRGGISPGASRQSLRTLGSWLGALSSLVCPDRGYLGFTLKGDDACFVLYVFFFQGFIIYYCNSFCLQNQKSKVRLV